MDNICRNHRKALAIGLTFLSLILTISYSAYAQIEQHLEHARTADLNEKIPPDLKISLGQLDNGMKYYIKYNQRPENRAELRLVINAGSILETDDQQGLAHFLEHMAFNGTRNFEKQEIVAYLESLGMRFGPELNAYTSFDETVYQLLVPTDDPLVLERAFLILEDWANNMTLDGDEIDKERGVVVEEWREGRGAQARIFDKQLPVLMKGSLYADRLPIGKKEILESFDHDLIRDFYKTWYRPDLMAVIVVGDIDKNEIEDMIKEHFGDIPRTENPAERQYFNVPEHSETLYAIATDREYTNSSVGVYYKLPAVEHSTLKAYKESLTEQMYIGILSSRFLEITQEADPPFIAAASDKDLFVRTMDMFSLNAAVKNDEILRGLEALLTEAERISRYGVTQSELDREKTTYMRGFERLYSERDKSNSGDFADEYIRNFLQKESIPGIEYEYELAKRFIPEITLDEVNALAKNYISEENRVILLSAPEKEDIDVPDENELKTVFEKITAKEIAPYEDVVSGESLLEFIPEPGRIVNENTVEELGVTEWKLSNGTTVVLKPTDFKEDQILFQAVSPGGTSLVSDDEYIPAATSTQILSMCGLGNYNVIELQKLLAGKVAGVGASVSNYFESVGGSASPVDIETLFQLIYMTFTEPRADDAVFKSITNRLGAVIQNRNANPAQVFQDSLNAILSGHHPRSRPMNQEFLKEMDLEKSFEFYKDRFADAGDFVFIFAGNIDVDVFKPLVERYIGGLPSTGRIETFKDDEMNFPEGVIKRTVRRGIEPKSQTSLFFTGKGEYSRQENYYLRSLGEVIDLMLRDILREELGGTYGVSVNTSFSQFFDQEYSLSIGFSTDPERIDELTDAIFRAINRMKVEGVIPEYVESVKETQRRTRETSLKQNGYWVSQLMFRYRDGQDPRDILTYDELIEELVPIDIQGAAIKYLNMDNYVQVSLLPEEKK
ncbi:M16 family metallopeptidase [candidate division KSB1 bacterium]